MSWLWLGLGLVGVAGLAALLYWQLIIAEGTYLGPRMVARTYDWVAGRYDAIKQFNPRDERWFVAGPLLESLQGVDRPLVLDVATGTGRLPLALLRERFRGQIVGLDLSQGMLRRARAKLQAYGDQVILVRQDAGHLPFEDGVFDAVTCLEALEFMPDPEVVLAEMVRVLAPGGVLFLTNRVGHEARLLPGRAISRSRFEQVLAALPLSQVDVHRWQVSYDLAMGRKLQAGPAAGGNDRPSTGGILSLLRCPDCGQALARHPGGLSCPAGHGSFPIREGVVHLAGRKTGEGS